MYFLWGLQAGYTDANTAGINVGIYAASSLTPLIGPLNSFNIGFSISNTSPINAMFNVRFKMFATGILQDSIVHNLPAGTSPTHCTYVYP